MVRCNVLNYNVLSIATYEWTRWSKADNLYRVHTELYLCKVQKDFSRWGGNEFPSHCVMKMNFRFVVIVAMAAKPQ